MTDPELNITVNKQELSVWLLCFFRYCLRRHTYAVGQCCEDLMKYWGVMPKYYREQIIDDIRHYIDNDLKYEHECDIKNWKKLLMFAEENLKDKKI